MPRTRTRTVTRGRTAAIAQAPVAVLRTREGNAVPLQGVTAHGRLEGLIFELTVEQRYRNDTNSNLEAVFTFPLPLRAVLLGFDLEIGDRKLKAQAVEKREASERYERAIDDGNTAALIEHDGNGLYTVSLGNLMAGEGALIRYRYVELLDAHDGFVRLYVPTVIAPRYGNPQDADLEGPAIPGVDLLGEYPFEISLDVKGVTNVVGLRSPSHEIVTTVREDGLTVRLTRSGFLDRDFVLELDQAAIRAHALVARDGDGYVALASATLGLDAAESRPLALKILLDCSGSMGGDSIAAAKRALLAIIDRLHPTDRISLTRFGSSIDHVTEGLEPADEHSLAPLQSVVRQIEADLGSTHMQAALESILALTAPADRQADVILITDGEIYDVAGVVDLAARSSHRLFAIAIGAAPNEALARSLADKTGGACEFVGPNEDAEAAILRTFKRLRSNPRTLGQVQWPTQPDWTAPEPTAVFPADTLHLFAGFSSLPSGNVTLSINDAAGQGTAIRLSVAPHLTEGDLLSRLAAARRITALNEADARDLAVKYQLATEHSSFIVVAEHADSEKAEGLPATVAVPHMLAAGWGGSAVMGAVASIDVRMSARIGVSASTGDSIPSFRRRSRSEDILSDSSSSSDAEEFFDIPVFLRRQVGDPATLFDPSDRTALLQSLLTAYQRGEPLPTTIAELAKHHPLTPGMIAALREIVASTGKAESEILEVLFALLAEDDTAKGLDRDFRSNMRGSILGSRAHRRLRSVLLKEVFS
jgi:Ca-activated chloride channel family protein